MKIKNLIIVLCVLFMTSCAISQGERVERRRKKLKGMSNAKLYKETVANYLDYQILNLKKISITYEEQGRKQEFRGSVRIQRDSIIWLSISKLGIEGVRVRLTPDSVSFIDRLHREYMITDYSYLNERFNMELDFFLIQSILTNRLPEYRTAKDLPFFRNFKGKKTDKHYLFYSKRRRDRQYWRDYRNSNGMEGNTLEILRVTPDLMRMESIDIYDTQFLQNGEGQQSLSFNLKYDNYKTYQDKYLFPERITATVRRELVKNAAVSSVKANKIILTIVVDRLEVNPKDLNFPFLINSKYKRIHE